MFEFKPFLFVESIVEYIGIWKPTASKALLYFDDAYFCDSFVIELIPFTIVWRFNIGVVMAGIGSSTMDKDRVELIDQWTIL